jgi:hypothetical protein
MIHYKANNDNKYAKIAMDKQILIIIINNI